MPHWRILMAALVLAFAVSLAAPFAGQAWADPDGPYTDEDPDDP